MQKISKILIIGGDKRQAFIADYLEDMGFEISVYGLDDKNRRPVDNLKDAAENAQAIVLPLPVSKDGNNITSNIKIKETADDIISLIKKDCVVFGGMIDKNTELKLSKKNIKHYDYFTREEVTVRNTVPTVEGIIKIIIDNTDYTIHSSNCAVFGFGKVGKVTAQMLSALGANVTVCARKQNDMAIAGIKKYNSCLISEFHNICHKTDIIINTVPSLVIDKEILEKLNKNCLIIDVASAPFGTDFATAYKLGINAMQCPSLPGKSAPKTAGIIIADSIINILKEENSWKN